MHDIQLSCIIFCPVIGSDKPMSPVEAECFSYIDNVFNMYMQLVIKLGPGSPMNLPFFLCSLFICHCSFNDHLYH